MAYSYDPIHPVGGLGAGRKASMIRRIRRHLVFSAFVFFALPAPAWASEDDKNAGICAGYLALLKKSDSSVNTALSLADNPRRALGIAKEWIRQAQRAGPSTGVAVDGDSACKRVGIRALDMR